jgi:plastocyanin
MKKYLITVLIVLMILLSGCTSAPDDSTAQPTAQQTVQATTQPTAQVTNTPSKYTTPPPVKTAEVEIIDFGYHPAEVIIVKGGTVTWSQKDGDPHTVIGANFASKVLNQGQKFSHTFNEAGTFDYWCSIHTAMRGKVIVVSD